MQPSHYNKKNKQQTTPPPQIIAPQTTKLSRVSMSTATTTPTERRASTRIALRRLITSNYAESAKQGQKSEWTPTQKNFANSIGRTSMEDVMWLINDASGQISQWLAEKKGSGCDFALCVLKTLVSAHPTECDELVDKWVKEDGWSKSQRDD